MILLRLIAASAAVGLCSMVPFLPGRHEPLAIPIALIAQAIAANGRYPPSLAAVWPDYLTGVAGIEQFVHEPHGEAFNLVFEQFTYRLGTREFVAYNPLDQHGFSSHAAHRLRRPQVDAGVGHYGVRATSFPHGKAFRFD